MASGNDQTRRRTNTPPSSEKESNPNGETNAANSTFQVTVENDHDHDEGVDLSIQNLDTRYVTHKVLKKEINKGVDEI